MAESTNEANHTPAAYLLSLLNNNNEAGERVQPTDEEADKQVEPTPSVADKQQHRREMTRLARQKKKEELERLRANQCHGITILMTRPNGEILTNRLTSESEYIEFITSVFESYKLQKQITDFRILRGEQPDL